MTKLWLNFGFDGRSVVDGINWYTTSVPYLMGVFVLMTIAYALIKVLSNLWLHPLSKIPGPLVCSISYFPFLWSNYIQGAWTRKMSKIHRTYGPIVRIGPNHLAIDGEIGWPEVFGRRNDQEGEFEKLPPTFAASAYTIMLAPREIHRRQRRHLSHAFSNKALHQQEQFIKQYTNMLLSRLRIQAERGQSVDIVRWLNCTTFDIIGELAFSDSFQGLENNAVHPWILSVFDSIRVGSYRRFLSFYPFARMLLAKLSDEFGNKQSKTRNSAKQKAQSRMLQGGYTQSGLRDFMFYMQQKTRDGETGMSEEEILETSATLVLAGSETVATALSGLFFYLAQNPQVYERLTTTIRNAFQTENDITMDAVAKVDYLRACINEILRLYPPAAETQTRVSPGSFIDGTYIPAGTFITVYQWATFRNPKHFAEPDSFIPERWLPDTDPLYDIRFKDDNHTVFKPFSHGSRDCIGQNLALNELRLIITMLLYQFDYELLPGQDAWHLDQRIFLLWEKSPLGILLKPRSFAKNDL